KPILFFVSYLLHSEIISVVMLQSNSWLYIFFFLVANFLVSVIRKQFSNELIALQSLLERDNKITNEFSAHMSEINAEIKIKIFNELRSEEHTSELQSRQYLVCR